jgi:hypothetical protein
MASTKLARSAMNVPRMFSGFGLSAPFALGTNSSTLRFIEIMLQEANGSVS